MNDSPQPTIHPDGTYQFDGEQYDITIRELVASKTILIRPRAIEEETPREQSPGPEHR